MPSCEESGQIKHFKGTVHPKIYISWKCTHSQAIQNVEEFVSSQWMCAVRMRVQTADKTLL